MARPVANVACRKAVVAAEAFRFDLYLDRSFSLVSAWAHVAAMVRSALCFGSSRSPLQTGCTPASLGTAQSQTPDQQRAGQAPGSLRRQGGSGINCCFPQLHRYFAPAPRSTTASLATPRM